MRATGAALDKQPAPLCRAVLQNERRAVFYLLTGCTDVPVPMEGVLQLYEHRLYLAGYVFGFHCWKSVAVHLDRFEGAYECALISILAHQGVIFRTGHRFTPARSYSLIAIREMREAGEP
jgi:hypothetical protein